MRYEAAKDGPITVLIYGVIALLAGAGVFAAVTISPLPLLIILLPIGYLLWMLNGGTYYELRDEYLYARSGFFSERIRYEKVTSLRKCRNMLSSMALAADRIEVRVGTNYVLGTTFISPVRRDEFLAELARRCPNARADLGR